MKNRLIWLCVFIIVLLVVLAVSIPAERGSYSASAYSDFSEKPAAFLPMFPGALSSAYVDTMLSRDYRRIYYVPSSEELEPEVIKPEELLQSVLLNNDIIAFYGHPRSPQMGIIGQYSLEELEPLLLEFAASYDKANGLRGVIPALYLIYGTCWPEGEIGVLSDAVIKKYIEYAAERGWYVFLDHQIGKYPVEKAVKALLPYLKYENVHLALDPEWRTTKPMKEIGSVTAAEVNMAQKMVEEYMAENSIPGRRFLVIHQFKEWMIHNRSQVKSNFDRIQLILCMDGFGSPSLKKNTYAFNALATNIPLKSFKLFSKPVAEGAGYDIPMMTPDEVFALDPRPYLIMMQ
ncbi:MAG: hypothetical protein LBR47_03960 [Spirochaetaceae bacterium]|jgi:hypothetical protein|nr:hypothetical protein [Spirochaetaceae bacterium]